ncbi:MAG: MinD/ParA family protein [Epsilonproteobacteria bacterium]|nr:MinD/ParA family protein [Campylobacterota bacterium]
MQNQADKLKQIVSSDTQSQNTPNTKFIAITSGKGGVGKSTISVNLAVLLAGHGYKVALFDADIGLANLDVLLKVRCDKNILNVLKGECSLESIIVPIKENLILIPGDSGDEILKYSDQFIFERFIEEASSLDDLDYIIVDTGAGIGEHTRLFLNASDEVIVVTVPDPAAITDAYATIKITSKFKPQVFMLLNMVKSENEAKIIFDKINKVAKANIGNDFTLDLIGSIRNDKNIAKTIRNRTIFVDEYPNSLTTIELNKIVKKLILKLEHKVLEEGKEKSFGSFIKRLFEQF